MRMALKTAKINIVRELFVVDFYLYKYTAILTDKWE